MTTFLNGELDDEDYMNQPSGFIMPGNEDKESLSSRFSMKDMGEANVILGIRIKYESNGIEISQSHYIEKAVSQLEYSRVIGTLVIIVLITVLEGYTDASWISNTKDNSSTSGCVFLLGGAAAGKEAEWLRNLILEILLWSKPITPISIHYDSVATLAKAYTQMYNGKSRHLVDHLTNGLARDFVLKSAEGIGLKSNLVIECYDT
ncbi:zinc finger, CCHC-type containing protein [Tanacetum coccineum]|uniref:Zinc finger, CCHC-type containing protein n=1 Tax=Tanacetum coccineum TaxID=301880 RepID=A0ABQ5HCN1_9ASTR